MKQVVVAEGEKNKRIAVVLQRPGGAQVAAPPPPLPGQAMQVQPLQPVRPGIPVSFQGNRDDLRIQADSFEANVHKSCTAPCAAELPAGNYMVGMARGDGAVRGMKPVYIGGPGTLKATYVSHTGLHVGGIILLIGAVLVQIGLSADAADKKTCDYSTGYCEITTKTDSSELGAATAIGIAGFTEGIIMIAQKNKSDVTFVPLGVGALSRGVPREGAWRAGSTVPQGGAIQVRF